MKVKNVKLLVKFNIQIYSKLYTTQNSLKLSFGSIGSPSSDIGEYPGGGDSVCETEGKLIFVDSKTDVLFGI
jgi:hypothetical protein